MYFRRKIDDFLIQWKQDPSHKPLIVKGARQIGKTESILHFANEQYSSVVYINFVLDKKFRMIVSDGYDVDTVIKNISLANPAIRFVAGETIIIFDEIQEYPDVATTLKAFRQDGRFDVICSGSMLEMCIRDRDGDRTPSRLDPFGSSDRRMEYYFLGEEGKAESTGYLFLEFWKEMCIRDRHYFRRNKRFLFRSDEPVQ